jgi:ABC-type phosphate/phosphonate transport system substrate-binding protein
MYNLPELEDIISMWWAGVARHMRDAGVKNVPDVLSTPVDQLQHWLDPDLLFSQTCGYPLVTVLKDKVNIIAIPLYNAPGCEGSDYSSMIIVREGLKANSLADLAGLDVAINGRDSHSGYNILRAMVADLIKPEDSMNKFFNRTLITHAHARSITSVKSGEAHCASIDAVTLALIRKYRPDDLQGIRVLCQSPPAPGLPFITKGNISDDELIKMQAGLFSALADKDLAPLCDALLIKGATLAQSEEYQRILDIEQAGSGIIL